ncbi:MAG: DNA methyltransferase [Armatimonadota bacterium]|nr:DNA methyltransferase [Armatimonadota bacterium]MDW8290250.1 DNA methyltransferase [Armatimonadota bacterium]
MQHSEQAFVQAVLNAKRAGMSDAQIGELFGVSFKQLERIITKTYGLNISILSRPKRVKSWAPPHFRLETTTVWSFKQRGSWATHDGRYRGNWSPYIPRNLILRYTAPGDLVLDPFVGGGTTAVEAKLLGRRCIARDINPACVQLTLENLRFTPPHTLFSETSIYEPEVEVGDARSLQGISDNSVDLICAHPPYAGIISYTPSTEGDLSQLSVPEFLSEMNCVAAECYRVLKPGKKCAVLIGDTRQRKHVVPIGFKTIEVFLRAGFRLRELVIKRQHNCKTTGFWSERSVQHNFLLLAHEYLPVFEKPEPNAPAAEEGGNTLAVPPLHSSVIRTTERVISPETTTVWVFPPEHMESLAAANIVQRYGTRFIQTSEASELIPLTQFAREMQVLVDQMLRSASKGEFIVLQTVDVRAGRFIIPCAAVMVDLLEKHPCLWLKEIIILAPDRVPAETSTEESLQIVHRYLLVYEVVRCGGSGAG